MRATEFIAEGVTDADIQEMAKIIERDCQPFLQATNNLKYKLFRGIKNLRQNGILTKSRCPVGREPADSSEIMHQIADDWFYDNTGIRFRSNSIFCSGRMNDADDYGIVTIMIPIGNFDFCWSPTVHDMFGAFDELVDWWWLDDEYDGDDDEDSDEYNNSLSSATDKLTSALRAAKYQFNSSIAGFRKGISSGNEMMIHCDEYYILRMTDETTQIINKLQTL